MRIWTTLTIGALVLAPASLGAQQPPTGFLDRVITHTGVEYAYQVYVPPSYRPSEAAPVILFLHGAGERGSDGKRQSEVGLGAAIREHPERWPAIVVLPQVPEGQSWVGPAGAMAMAALDQTLGGFRGDPTRIYLTGLSMGGNGSWALGYRHPDRFAAIVAVCGFLSSGPGFPSFLATRTVDAAAEVAARLKGIPIQVFHGDADRVVPATESRQVVAALRAVGADVQYTELPGVGHNAWDAAYGSAEVARWLFSQRKR